MDRVSKELKAVVKRINKDVPEFYSLARDCPYKNHIADKCNHEQNPTVTCDWKHCPMQ